MAERSLGVEVFGAMRHDIATIREQEGKFAAARASLGHGAVLLTIFPYTLGGLEVTLATVGAKVFQYTEGMNPVAAIGAVTATVALTSGAIEAVLSKGLSRAMIRLPGAARVLERRKYQQPLEVENESAEESAALPSMTIPENVAATSGIRRALHGVRRKAGVLGAKAKSAAETASLAMGAGSPGIMLRSFVQSPGADPDVHLKKGYRTARVLTAVNTLTGGIYGGILAGASTLNSVQSGLGERTLDVLSSAVTWLGAFALQKAAPYINNAERTSREAGGRGLVFSGDSLGYQTLAAQVEANRQIMDIEQRTVRQMEKAGV